MSRRIESSVAMGRSTAESSRHPGGPERQLDRFSCGRTAGIGRSTRRVALSVRSVIIVVAQRFSSATQRSSSVGECATVIRAE